MNNKTCCYCSFFVRVGFEDIEENDSCSCLCEYGVCANQDGMKYDGNKWVQLNTHNRFTKIWENTFACKHFEEDEEVEL